MATIEQPVATATGDAAVAGGQPTSEWTRRWKRFLRNRLAVVSLAFIIVVAVVALASPLIAPYGYATIHRGQELLPSFTEGFLMGTDPLGRDVFSRLVYSIRTALFIAIAAELISLAVAFVVGLIAGYKGGKYDQILMAGTDVMYAFPGYRSEEHTSELQSRGHLVCRLLLEKKSNAKTHREVRGDFVSY